MLYKKSSEGYKFNSLLQHIEFKENILLAYTNIKTNKSSMTVGIAGLDINFFKKMTDEEFINYIQNKLN